MKIALFGGTFNPIHVGHLLMAESASERFKLDRVIFLPVGAPPHKPAPGTSARHRLAMIRLAIRGNPRFVASDWEIRQGRPVYSIESLTYFGAQHPKDKLFFIVGTDSLRAVPGWQRGDEVLKAASFLAVERPGCAWRSLPAVLRRQAQVVASWPVPFASHEIRRLLSEGRSIRYQVPATVERYIRRHRLYRKRGA